MQRKLKIGYQPGRHELCMSWHMCHVAYACGFSRPMSSAFSQHRSRDSCRLARSAEGFWGITCPIVICMHARLLFASLINDGLTFEPKASKMRQLGTALAFLSICRAQVVQAGSEP